jgi:hypothetical protein
MQQRTVEADDLVEHGAEEHARWLELFGIREV